MDTLNLPPVRPVPPSHAATVGARNTWQLWYDHLIDYIIANPTARVGDMAKYVGRSYNYVTLLVRNDMFQLRLAARRKEHSETLSQAVNDKLTGVALSSLDLIAERLERQKSNVPLKDLVNLADSVLERLGYGVKQPAAAPAGGVNVQVNVGADPKAIAAARERIQQNERAQLIASPTAGSSAAQPLVIEGEVEQQV